MKTAAEIALFIREKVKTLDLLGETPVSGFALIVPPGDEPIVALNIGSHVDLQAFYTELAGAMKEAMKAGGAAVGVPGSGYRQQR